MAEPEDHQTESLPITELTAEIVGAYVAHHTVAVTDLPALIATVGQQVAGLSQAPAELEEEKPVPAVPIKKSVTPDHIICLEDGKKLKMLKRHLKTRYDMTPEDYRRRWGLKDDYPMVGACHSVGSHISGPKDRSCICANQTLPSTASDGQMPRLPTE